MGDAVSLWLHLLAVTIWIGPQVFLFAAALPALRTVDDLQERTRLTRLITTRFGWLGGGAVAVIVTTGIVNLVQVDGHSVSDLVTGDLRFTRIFWEKMVLVALSVSLVGLHVFAIGPRQLALAEQPDPDAAEMRNLRRLSISLSVVGLLASVGALYLGALLGHHEYSLLPD
jgi:uncharacterized membrane protein